MKEPGPALSELKGEWGRSGGAQVELGVPIWGLTLGTPITQ